MFVRIKMKYLKTDDSAQPSYCPLVAAAPLDTVNSF